MSNNINKIYNDEIYEMAVEELRDALSAQELQDLIEGAAISTETATAALRAAIALGYCRLYGIDLGEEEGVLPTPVALAAANGLQVEVDTLRQEAETLPQRWDDTEETRERDELCLDLLRGRMDVQAAFIAVEEALAEAQCQGEISWEQYAKETDALVAGLDKLDQTFQQREILEILSSVTDYPLLRNWRQMLADEFRPAQFWWLDGQLESVAQQLTDAFVREAPSPEAWRRVREAKRLREAQKAALLRMCLLRAVFTRRIAAASEATSATLAWTSPDGRFQALCRVALGGTLPGKLTLYFMQTTGEPAPELTNAPVWWAGIASSISQEGSAVFEAEKLRKALEGNQMPELLVGPQQQLWLLTPASVQALTQYQTDEYAEPGSATS